MMRVPITIDLDEDIVDALDKLIAELRFETSRELAVVELIRDCLIYSGYLPADDIEQNTPTEGDA